MVGTPAGKHDLWQLWGEYGALVAETVIIGADEGGLHSIGRSHESGPVGDPVGTSFLVEDMHCWSYANMRPAERLQTETELEQILNVA